MKWLPEILIAAALLFAGLALTKSKFNRAPTAIDRRSYASIDHADHIINHMMDESTHDIAGERFERKVAAARKMDLMNAVSITCLEKYQRELCVTNLITCGVSCKALIPKERFTKIEADYWALVDERHLRGKLRRRR